MKINNEKFSVNFFSNFSLIFIFILFVPYHEWPDANQHFSNNTVYSQFYRYILDFFNIKNIEFIQIENLNYFSGNFFFFKIETNFWINSVKLIYVIPLFFILNKFSHSVNGKDIVFAPPLIFSILHPSMESFSIFFILWSFILCRSSNILSALVVGLLATLMDRSMVPTFFFIILLSLFLKIKNFKTQQLFFCITIIFLFISYFLLIGFYEYIFNFYSLTKADIYYLNNSGSYSYFALLASLSGLYGWMSLKPFPWFLYYSTIISFFLFGLTKINRQKKIELFICFFVVFFLIYILPSLNQARYFPVLILLLWETVLVGFKYISERTDLFLYLVILSTVLGFFIEL